MMIDKDTKDMDISMSASTSMNIADSDSSNNSDTSIDNKESEIQPTKKTRKRKVSSNLSTDISVTTKKKTGRGRKAKASKVDSLHGVFSNYKFTREEIDTYYDFLRHTMNNPVLDFVKCMLGDDFLMFIDVLAGTTMKIPSESVLRKDAEATKIFLYLKRNNFTISAIRSAAKLFDKTNLVIRKMAYRVARTLGIEDVLEGDVLNNYLLNIKSVDVKYVKSQITNGNSVEEILAVNQILKKKTRVSDNRKVINPSNIDEDGNVHEYRY